MLKCREDIDLSFQIQIVLVLLLNILERLENLNNTIECSNKVTLKVKQFSGEKSQRRSQGNLNGLRCHEQKDVQLLIIMITFIEWRSATPLCMHSIEMEALSGRSHIRTKLGFIYK